MPLYYFKRDATLTDGTRAAEGWRYLTPEQMHMIPGVSAELASQQAQPDARDVLAATGLRATPPTLESRLSEIERRLDELESRS
jgi:hypothetical protein